MSSKTQKGLHTVTTHLSKKTADEVFSNGTYGARIQFDGITNIFKSALIVPPCDLQFNADGTVTGQVQDCKEDDDETPIMGIYDPETLKLVMNIPAVRDEKNQKTFKLKCRLIWKGSRAGFSGLGWLLDSDTSLKEEKRRHHGWMQMKIAKNQ